MITSRFRRVPMALLAACASFAFAFAAHAAPAPGDLVKLKDGTAVYYVGDGGKRYAFPNAKTYATWYADFSTVKVVAPADLAALTLGGNVTYRPGTRLVKIVSDPKVYAVEPSGKLRPIASEAVAKALYGADWNKKVDDVADAFFVNYSVGDALIAATYPEGSVVKRSSDGAVFRIEAGAKRRIPDGARALLRIQDAFIVTTSSSLAEYPDGAPLATAEASIVDTAQKAAAQLPSLPTLGYRVPATPAVTVGVDSTLFELGAASTQGFTIKRLAFRLAATTGANLAPSEDVDEGGLIFGNNAQPNFTALRLVDESGAEPFGRKEVARLIEQDQEQTFVFDGSFTVPAGTSKRLRLVAFVNPLIPNREGYQVTLLRAQTQIVDAAGTPAAFAPAADIIGSELSAQRATLEVSAAGTPGSPTYVRGTANAAIAGFAFRNDTGAAVIVNGLTLQGYIDEESDGVFLPGGDSDNGTETRVEQLLPAVSLYDDATGAKVAGPVPVDLKGKAVFTGIGYAIPYAGRATLVVKGDLSKTVELENRPDRVTFNILDPKVSVVAVDGQGNAVGISPVNLNADADRNNAPVYAAYVKKGGKMDIRWNPGGGNGVAGTEIQLGTLEFDPDGDDYDIRTVAFTQVGGASKALSRVRLEYRTAAGATASTSADIIGNDVALSSLPVIAPRDVVTTLTLFGKLATRDGGALSGERIKMAFSSNGPLEFVSRSTGEKYTTASFGADFRLTANEPSGWTVRYSDLTGAKVEGIVGPVTHSADQEVLRFTLAANAAGPVRVKKMTFRLTPSDAGTAGANNDALERWADLNGDFPEDDLVADLRRVVENEIDPTIGEGSAGHMKFSIVHGGVQSDVSSTLETDGGDYGLLEYSFDDNSEYSIPAGATATFSLFVDTNNFSNIQDYVLATSLLPGNSFLWTDIPFGAYTALGGTDAVAIGFSNSLIVKH